MLCGTVLTIRIIVLCHQIFLTNFLVQLNQNFSFCCTCIIICFQKPFSISQVEKVIVGLWYRFFYHVPITFYVLYLLLFLLLLGGDKPSAIYCLLFVFNKVSTIGVLSILFCVYLFIFFRNSQVHGSVIQNIHSEI